MRFLISLFLITFLTIPLHASAHGEETHMEILPSSVAYESGEEITVTVMVHAAKAATSIRIELSYDAATLQVNHIEPSAGHFPFLWKSEGADGVVMLEASSPTPGVQGDLLAATITFEAIQAGSSEIAVSDTSLVLNAQDQNMLEKEPVENPQDIQAGPLETVQPGYGNINGALVVGAVLLVILVVGGGAVLFLRQKKKV